MDPGVWLVFKAYRTQSTDWCFNEVIITLGLVNTGIQYNKDF